MIYLYTLPGVSFCYPYIDNPMLKGYLSNKNITTQHIDLSMVFLNECINKKYITNLKHYTKLDSLQKEKITLLDEAIETIKSKKASSKEILESNYNFVEGLNAFASLYNINWTNKGIFFPEEINTVDKLVLFSEKEDNAIFDYIFVNETKRKFKRNDIVYISVPFENQMPYALRFSKILKQKQSDIKIVLGGNYITHIIENCIELLKKCNNIDAIKLFNYLETFNEMLNCFSSKNYETNNVFFKINNQIIKNEISHQKEINCNYYIPNFDGLYLSHYLSKIKTIPLLLNYGCWYNGCSFCSRSHYYGGYMPLNFELICDFLKKEVKNKQIEGVILLDECVPAVTLLKFADFLISNNIDIKWMVETRIEESYLNKNFVKKIYESGCRHISFGIESFNKNILALMNKNIDLKLARKVMKEIHKQNIMVSATFMIGYPNEKNKHIKNTMEFIKNFKYIDTFGLSVFNLVRNSFLTSSIKIEAQNINLVYNSKHQSRVKYLKLRTEFYQQRKIREYILNRNKVLNRSQYLYLDRKIISFNYSGTIGNRLLENVKKWKKLD